jgi:hypothetical protein
MSVIALLSDLGERDYFIGAMKGAILSVNPDAKIVDITHQISKHDIRAATFVLSNAAETFPQGTIFITVIDPGVGTKRRCLLLRTHNNFFFIGPDNGVFTLVAERFGVERIFEVTNRELMRPQISDTFHGRDVMAPVAAHLSLDLNPRKVGPELKGMKRARVSKPELKRNELRGEVLHIDDFGNLVTNISRGVLEKFVKIGVALNVKIKEKKLKAQLVKTFGEVARREPLCYIGSTGLLEIAINRGNLAQELGASPGDKVILRREIKKSRGRSKIR